MDNTPAITGFKGGQVYLQQEMLGRKLHLIGCSLHFNELPIRNMVEHLDGGTTSGT